MALAGNRFTIDPERWYAWHSFPGPADDGAFNPYLSPIYVEHFRPKKSGAGLFEIRLVNAAYTEGIQHFDMTLKILKRASAYAVAEIAGEQERTGVIGEISFEWLRKHFTDWWTALPADSMPEPYQSNVQAYLERRLGLLHT